MPVRTPKNRIVDLNIVEGALVDDGDNPKAHIVLFKSGTAEADGGKDGGSWQPRSTSERLAQRKFMEDFYDVRSAYVDSINDVLYMVPADEMGAALEKSTTEFEAEVTKLLDAVAKSAPSVAKAGRLLVKKTVEAAATHDSETITKALEAFGASPQDTQEDPMATPATKSNDTATNTAPKAKTIDEIVAALPEAERATVKAALEAAAKATADAEAAAVKARGEADDADTKAKLKAQEESLKATQAELAKMKDEKLTAEFKAKAETIGVGDVDVMATLLKGAFGRSKEEGEALESQLKAMAAQAKKGGAVLLKVVGSDNPSGNDGSTDPLDVKAADLMKADKSLTYHQAYSKASEMHPDLARTSYVDDRAKRVEAAKRAGG